MRKVLFVAACLSLFVPLGLAQTLGTGPGISKAPAPSKDLTFGPNGKLPLAATTQHAFFQLPGDPPGVWTACFTGMALPKQWGGVGGSDCLLGKYDRRNGTFTPTDQAANLNTVGGDGPWMIDPKGRYAIIDRNDAFWFSSRSGINAKFNAPVKVLGLVASLFKDFETPALGWVGGKLKIFFVKGKLYMADLDLTNPAKPTVPPQGTWVDIAGPQKLEDPHPIAGPDGDVEGMMVTSLPGGFDSDVAFLNDLDPSTPAFTVIDTTGPAFNDSAAVAGSLMTGAERQTPGAVLQVETSWLLGDREKIGGTADIFGASRKVGAGAVVTVIFFASKPIGPISIPGFKGSFALDLTTLTVLGIMTHGLPSEMASLSFPLPNDNTFSGLKLALQGLSVDPTAGTKTFTNTAWLVIQ